MVTVCDADGGCVAMTTFPVRLSRKFGCALMRTLPVPLPGEPLTMPSQTSPVLAAHVQPAGDETITSTVPPPDGTGGGAFVDTDSVHGGGAGGAAASWVTVNVCPFTTIVPTR